ncbi:partial 26 kDa periplasmic immunogenic protein, partial [uncultured bacterium]
ALKAAGIAEKDIQTTYYSVYTEQRYKPETGEATGEIIYHASASVSVTIRDISQVGAVLDKAVAAGANNISGVSFSVADTTGLEATARERAVADARARAADLAHLFGVQVGEVTAISEVVNSGPVPVYDRATGLGGGGTPIQPGQLSISTQLQVTFNLK